MPSAHSSPPKRLKQRGAALLLILLIALTLALTFSFRPSGDEAVGRIGKTHDALLNARAALIGKAAAERSNNGILGLLPMPDLGSNRNGTPEEGNAAGDFSGNTQNMSVIGRLPWRTLGLPPQRDADGECLWYSVSGSAKNVQPPLVFNWDSIGHFETFNSDGTPIGTVSNNSADPHSRPLALVFAPSTPLGEQDRTASASDLVTECGGNYSARNYLDTFNPDPRINNIFNYFNGTTNSATGDASSAPKALATGKIAIASSNSMSTLVNDQLLSITARDIFDVVKKRSDFKTDIDTLLADLANYLNTLTLIPPNLPTAFGSKGIDAVVAKCLGDTNCPIRGNAAKTALLNQWRDNLLYAGGPSGIFTVNGNTDCKAILIFAGERTTRTAPPAGVQQRSTAIQKDDPTMYLEGGNATFFPNNGVYAGATAYNASASSADIVRCITGLPPGATQISLASDLGSFYATGPSGGAAVTANNDTRTVSFADVAGTGNACFWSPIIIPLAGKTLRAYYEYRFAFADAFATGGSSADRGNGFTFQLVRGDIPNVSGIPSAPNTCGTESNLGALGTSDIWGSFSYIVETDVRRNSTQLDPVGNHTAIMTNGSLRHGSPPGPPSSACDGSTNGCQFNPANTFEEVPKPLTHNQRIEIHNGCNAGCTQCNPYSSGTPGYTNARISVWVDCTACADTSSDLIDGELIFAQQNRDFSAPGNWQGNSWTLTANALTHIAGTEPATLPNTALTAPAIPGKTYRVEIGMRTDTPGSVSIAFGGISTNSIEFAVGNSRYTHTIDAASGSTLTLSPDAVWEGALTFASIKSVTQATARRCVALPAEMNRVFLGLTGGFLSNTDTTQGVTLQNLYIRSN